AGAGSSVPAVEQVTPHARPPAPAPAAPPKKWSPVPAVGGARLALRPLEASEPRLPAAPVVAVVIGAAVLLVIAAAGLTMYLARQPANDQRPRAAADSSASATGPPAPAAAQGAARARATPPAP